MSNPITATEALDRLNDRNFKFLTRNNEIKKRTGYQGPYGQWLPAQAGLDKVSAALAVECNHTFVPYVGLAESYEFCTKCDHKKVETTKELPAWNMM